MGVGGGLSGAHFYTECDYQHHCSETQTLLFHTLKVSTTGVENTPWECRGGGGYTCVATLKTDLPAKVNVRGRDQTSPLVLEGGKTVTCDNSRHSSETHTQNILLHPGREGGRGGAGEGGGYREKEENKSTLPLLLWVWLISKALHEEKKEKEKNPLTLSGEQHHAGTWKAA